MSAVFPYVRIYRPQAQVPEAQTTMLCSLRRGAITVCYRGFFMSRRTAQNIMKHHILMAIPVSCCPSQNLIRAVYHKQEVMSKASMQYVFCPYNTV